MLPGNIPSQQECDGCGANFSVVCHTLEYKTSGFIILQHNEITDELCNLVSKALAPLIAQHVKPPIINPVCPTAET
jgi:hypothetical protein